MREQDNVIDFIEGRIRQRINSMRPPKEIRDELDLGFSFDGRELILHEIRPHWNDPDNFLHIPFARAVYLKSRKIWKIYWMRASGSWEWYEPAPLAKTVDEFFDLVEEDKLGCFQG